jgi:tetratricopeptide (TPR) repeat protein
MSAPTVFISYSHRDEEWKKLLLPQLRALEQAERIVVWDDRKIDAGDKWYPEIKEAMEQAAVAVCLISPDFLASDFCVKEEVPFLLQRCERDGMILIPLLLRPCLWRAFPWLSEFQMLPRDGKSVYTDFRDHEDEVFAELAGRIFEIVDTLDYQPPPPPPPRWSPPEQIEISRLPVTGAELFGRRQELEMLDAAWASDRTNVVSLVAWGGVGKSTLVNKWLERMAGDNYRGARRVYAWSFYNQGTGERVTSADLFINNALKWFGDTDPTAGSPWDKGERLARLAQSEKTLLLLDGLEPLQSPHAHERGKIKDPALLTLLTELARHNPGLCLITTREQVIDLAEFEATTLRKDLEQISDEAGRALLRIDNAQGTDAELEQATRDFGNHALAINLLAVYLRDVSNHHISHAAGIPDLAIPESAGKHPRRLMAAFARRFGDGPEVELLNLLGLFDRPADSKSLEALRAAPPIPALTDYLHSLSEADWLRLIDKLRRTKLIAPAGHHWDTDLDAHPLVREHFGQEFKQAQPHSWREGNKRLFQHLERTTRKFPATVEETTPIYAAVTHGCNADYYKEALKLFSERTEGRVLKLGNYGAVLAVMSNFFEIPWSKPVTRLRGRSRTQVLSTASFCLRSLGRLPEAIEPLQASLKETLAQNDLTNAANDAINLSELFLTIGDLKQSLFYAQQILPYAQQGKRFPRFRFFGPSRSHPKTYFLALFLWAFRGFWMTSETDYVSQAVLAYVLHQQGRMLEAATAFREAERIHREMQPGFPILYSLSGFYYCEFLLDRGKYKEVKRRARQLVKWHHQYPLEASLLCCALDYLSLGRANLLLARQKKSANFTQAASHLKKAVAGLRQAGTQDFLPHGLLARAELHRSMRALEVALIDLNESMSIATRGNMGLHEADCHLEYARLYLARGERELARASWSKAREMIERMGYHRRDNDVKEIEQQLKEV